MTDVRRCREYSKNMFGNVENIARICVDIVIIALIGVSAVSGWRKGLASVIFSCFRWLICIGLAFFAVSPVKEYLKEKTGFGNAITSHVQTTMNSSTSGNSFFLAIPEQFRGVVQEYQQSIASQIAKSVSNVLLEVLAFLIVFLVLIVVTKLFTIALESRKKRGPIGYVNSFLGFTFGVIKGVFIISVLMLAMFPILGFVDPLAVSPIVAGIRQSAIAGLFYDHNPIALLFEMF